MTKRRNPNQLSLFDEEPTCEIPASSPQSMRPERQSTTMSSPRFITAPAKSSSPQHSAPELSPVRNGAELAPAWLKSNLSIREGLILQIKRDTEGLADPVFEFDHPFLRERIAAYRAEVQCL